MNNYLAVEYAVTWADNQYTITWAENQLGLTTLTFSSYHYVAQTLTNENLFNIGTASALTTLDYRQCTSPVGASRTLLLAAVEALISEGGTFETVTAENVISDDGTFENLTVNAGFFVTEIQTETIQASTLTPQRVLVTDEDSYLAVSSVASSDLVSTSNSVTLTNKTISLTNNTVTGTTAEFNTALTDGNFATLAGTETLTNKTINLANNTLTGTTAQFNTALSDANFATLLGTESLLNKTLHTPSITRAVTVLNSATALSSPAHNNHILMINMGTGAQITLPTNALGNNYKFVVRAVAGTGDVTIVSGGANIRGHYFATDDVGDGTSSAVTTLTLVSANLTIGDTIEMFADGNQGYYFIGFMRLTGSITFS